MKLPQWKTWLLAAMFGSLILSGHPLRSEEKEKKENPPAKKKVGRAMIEGWGLMAISVANYQIKYTKFIEDWQYEWIWKDQKERFFTFQANRLDSNAFKSNWTHGFSGFIYYSMARTNGLNWRTSTLFSLVGSLFWEYVSEWREVISINDNIFTPFGGPAVGEPLFQFGKYFQGRRGAANKIVGAVFNPILALNNILDKNFFRRDDTLSPPIEWRSFNLIAGRRDGFHTAATERFPQTHLALDMNMLTIPRFGDPGWHGGWMKDTLESDLYFDIGFSSKGVEEYNARTRAVLFGLFRQWMKTDEWIRWNGQALLIGGVTSFELMKKRARVEYDTPSGTLSDPRFPRPRPTEFADKLGVISPIGLAVDFFHIRKGWQLRFGVDILLDFGLVNSFPYNAYSADADVDLENIKTTLLSWGYYYAFGYTLQPRLWMRYRNLEFRGDIQYRRFRSIQGVDRFQDIVTDDFHLVDSRFIVKARLNYHIPKTPLLMSLGLESIDRRGHIKALTAQNRETRLYYQVGLDF